MAHERHAPRVARVPLQEQLVHPVHLLRHLVNDGLQEWGQQRRQESLTSSAVYSDWQCTVTGSVQRLGHLAVYRYWQSTETGLPGSR